MGNMSSAEEADTAETTAGSFFDAASWVSEDRCFPTDKDRPHPLHNPYPKNSPFTDTTPVFKPNPRPGC